MNKEHRWSGFPGAYCLDCGAECQAELCLAQNTPECRAAMDENGMPAPGKCPHHGKGTECKVTPRGGHHIDEADPVHLEPADQKWYFWDETWADRLGPYDTEVEARAKLVQYCKEVLGP